MDVASRLGAKVAAVTSRPDEVRARLGADVAVLDAAAPVGELLRSFAPDGVDVIVDPVGSPEAGDLIRRLGYDGRLLVVGFASGTVSRLPAQHVLLRNRSAVGVDLGAYLREGHGPAAELLSAPVERLVAGRLLPRPVRAVGFHELIDLLRSDAPLSDVVLVPGSS